MPVSHVELVDKPLAALGNAAALMILTPWPEYSTIDSADIAAHLAGRVVIDPYGVLDRKTIVAAGLEYHSLGVK